MASSDDMVELEGSFSSLLVDSLKSNQSGDDLSPEDISWVDSCLVKDPYVSDSDWTSMKDALIEILGLQPEPPTSQHSSPPMSEDSSGGTSMEIITSAKPGKVNIFGRANDGYINNAEMETVNDGNPVEKEAEYILSEHFQGDISETSFRNAFLPHYSEDTQAMGDSISLENDVISSSMLEIEPIARDIFKVWDLGTYAEEDDLSKQLKKALSESSDQTVPSIDDSRALKDLKEQSVDDLITGLADLSLGQHPN